MENKKNYISPKLTVTENDDVIATSAIELPILPASLTREDAYNTRENL